jgi:hypothetical protein
MPVIPVNKLVDLKRIIGKNGRGGGEAQGVADPKKKKKIGDFTQNIAIFGCAKINYNIEFKKMTMFMLTKY